MECKKLIKHVKFVIVLLGGVLSLTMFARIPMGNFHNATKTAYLSIAEDSTFTLTWFGDKCGNYNIIKIGKVQNYNDSILYLEFLCHWDISRNDEKPDTPPYSGPLKCQTTGHLDKYFYNYRFKGKNPIMFEYINKRRHKNYMFTVIIPDVLKRRKFKSIRIIPNPAMGGGLCYYYLMKNDTLINLKVELHPIYGAGALIFPAQKSEVTDLCGGEFVFFK